MTLFAEAGFVSMPASTSASIRSSRWKLAKGSRCFDGHFDGSPILPGVAHIALALRACSEEAAGPRVLLGLRDVRFKRPLGPGDEVDLTLADGPEPSSVRFEIRSHGEPASGGLLLFAATDGGSGGR